MANLPQLTPLPADLPVNWQQNQIVSPNGTEAGLTQQHGYNYLNGAVNQAQSGVNTLQTSVTQINQEVSNATQEIITIKQDIVDIDQDLGKVAPEIKTYNILLTAGNWAINSTSEAALTGMYLQQITAATFTANQRVDISLPPSTMSSIPAGITTANVSGTVYAVTEFPPSSDVDAQITVITVVEVS